MFVNPESCLIFCQSPGFEFGEGCFNVIDFKETSFLSRIAAILAQANLDFVTPQNNPLRIFSAGEQREAH